MSGDYIEGQDIVPYKVRAYLYRVVTALATIAVIRGWITPEDASALQEVLTAVLVIGTPGLASVYTPRKS